MPINMAYCRFENTLHALVECADALDEGGIEELSEAEQREARKLIKLCKRIADDYGDETP